MSVIIYRVALLVSLIGLGAASLGLVYSHQNVTSLNNQVTSLGSQRDSERDQIGSLRDQISNLTRQIDHLSSQITQLQQANSDLLNQIIQLEKQLGGGGSLCSSGKTIPIGELLDLSGPLSDQGTRSRYSSQIARDDVNSFLHNAGCSLSFDLIVNDYALDNQRALTELQSLNAQGVQVVVGPLNSGAAGFILSYANSHHIVLLSPSSSSPVLAIPNDYLFRSSPNDAAQAPADARMMRDRGADAVIIVYRHDAYGDYVASAIATSFAALGGHVIDSIPYDISTSDFTPILSILQTDFRNNLSYGAGHIALAFASFEEFGSLIIQAKQQYTNVFPWSTLPWFGTDGLAQDAILTSNVTLGPLLAQVKLPSTIFIGSNNTKTVAFLARFNNMFPGRFCDFYCFVAYDDVWLAALATLQAGAYDGTRIQSVMLTVASNYYGVTGWNGLDQNGDRIPESFQIWKVVSQGSASRWALAGTYTTATDSITWNSPP